MIPKLLTMRLIVALLVVVSSVTLADYGRRAKPELVIVGWVVAYDERASLANITSAPQLQILIVRIAKRLAGREESRYLKVVYEYMQNEAKLPSEVFDGKTQWRFALMKTTVQDQRCRSPLQGLKRITGTGNEEVPSETSLPCYALRSGDFKVNDKR